MTQEGGRVMNTKSTSDEVNHEAVLETGKNLVQGLIDGANSKSQALVDAVTQFAKGSVDAISRGGRVMEFPKHTAYEFLVESGLHDQADELMELMEQQEALEAKDDGAGAKPE